MSFLRTLRKLVLGETWLVPVGVAVVVGLAAMLAAVAEDPFRDAGGPALLAGILVVFALSVRR